ncbi:hypothetical protein BV25DRAFT_1269723 [Artomyces pyxidatus]|uniref:Uncharacterized protein n=1 Tax=Artomyces pyxidatus TaxID=48021 RepID=A0ACB8TF06_9AGAM|nr:hypothetical protein BV25DRAFT_1269723 [Artomyces pyxidatus]
MPVADKPSDSDEIRDLEKERDREREREKGPKSKGSSKSAPLPFSSSSSPSDGANTAKDLSHVPCKFFKVGSCTAGASCPFSHSAPEPGQQKGVCAWFVKGNCKFGHKCALAHILPGQPMAMDRKNKKAAQAAASANGQGWEGGRGTKGTKQGAQNGATSGSSNGQARNSLLSGSTAPTRILPGSGRAPIPMSLKATISPSAPAPPLQDTDFGLPDESNKLPNAPAQGKPSPTEETAPQPEEQPPTSATSPAPLPFSTPSAPRRTHGSATSADLGVIGSPPKSVSSHEQPARVNGFSPGTSPAAHNQGFLSTSPFSAPGTQSVFFSYDGNDSEELKTRSGIAASLGATRSTWRNDLGPHNHDALAGEVVVEDEDLEEFIPGSLSDLLTPEERSRRYSRTHATNPAPAVAPIRDGWGTRPSAETHHHRYSRSVPAPSLLGDIKSIWADNNDQGVSVIGSPRTAGLDHGGSPATGVGILGSGTPSSFKSSSAFGGRSLMDDHITTFLSPSNASAAFLPGTHQHYLSAKGGMQRTGGGNLRPGAYTPSNPPVNAANLLARFNDPAPPQPSGQHRQFDGTSESFGGQPFQLGRPIPGGEPFANGQTNEERAALSPSARALQAHAPGQSLPQGLAAGYSRIHALPPPPVIPSPSSSGAFVPSQSSGFQPGTSLQGNAHFTDWIGMSPAAANGGLEPMHPRMSYSGAAARPSHPQAPAGPTVRTPSGKGQWTHGTPLSPLSGPVLTGDDDDDDLFSMDG